MATPTLAITMRTLITTIGTSVLTNGKLWRHGEPVPERHPVEHWLSATDPVAASAETNSWHRLDALGAAETRVVLAHSSTNEGRLAAEVLADYARNFGPEAVLVEVPRLGQTGEGDFNRALASLAKIICEQAFLAGRRGYAEIIATGGYKAETAVATTIGAMLKIPVHYIHESFKDIVTLEPLPVSLDIGWLNQPATSAFLDILAGSLDHCVGLNDKLRALLKAEERLWLLVNSVSVGEGTLMEANPLGEIAIALRGEAPVQWPARCETLPADKVRLDLGHHKPAGWRQFIDTLSGCSFVTGLRFDGALGKATGMHVGPAPGSVTDIAASLGDQASPPLRLRVGTTANCDRQRRMVIGLLKRELGLA